MGIYVENDNKELHLASNFTFEEKKINFLVKSIALDLFGSSVTGIPKSDTLAFQGNKDDNHQIFLEISNGNIVFSEKDYKKSLSVIAQELGLKFDDSKLRYQEDVVHSRKDIDSMSGSTLFYVNSEIFKPKKYVTIDFEEVDFYGVDFIEALKGIKHGLVYADISNPSSFGKAICMADKKDRFGDVSIGRGYKSSVLMDIKSLINNFENKSEQKAIIEIAEIEKIKGMSLSDIDEKIKGYESGESVNVGGSTSFFFEGLVQRRENIKQAKNNFLSKLVNNEEWVNAQNKVLDVTKENSVEGIEEDVEHVGFLKRLSSNFRASFILKNRENNEEEKKNISNSNKMN